MVELLVSRRPLQTKDLHHDFIVENIIGDQKVSLVKNKCLILRNICLILLFIYLLFIIICTAFHKIKSKYLGVLW